MAGSFSVKFNGVSLRFGGGSLKRRIMVDLARVDILDRRLLGESVKPTF